VLGDHHEIVAGTLAQRCAQLSLRNIAVRHRKALDSTVVLQHEQLVNLHRIHL
jgi:hypothetical protein